MSNAILAIKACTFIKCSRLQRRMRRKFLKTGENHAMKLKQAEEKEIYQTKDDSLSAKLSYSRQDNCVQPEDVTDDVPSGDL